MISYYRKNSVDLDAVIETGMNKYGLERIYVIHGAEKLYRKILEGLNMLPIALNWGIIIEARKLKSLDLGSEIITLDERVSRIEQRHMKWARIKNFLLIQ